MAFKKGDVIRIHDVGIDEIDKVYNGMVDGIGDFYHNLLVITRLYEPKLYLCEILESDGRESIELYESEIVLDKVYYRKKKIEKLIENQKL